MKKLALVVALLFCSSWALGQACVPSNLQGCTPNVQLALPFINAPGPQWANALNQNTTLLDQLLSGNANITGLKFSNGTISGNVVFSGNVTISSLDNVISVDGSTYARTDAGVQAALTALHAQGGGRLYLTDGTYSALTTTISLNCKEQLFVGVMNATSGYQLQSSGSPAINMTGTGNGSPDCGTVVRGISRFASQIQGTGGTSADVINVAANCNGCMIENLDIKGQSANSRDAIRIQDGQRNLVIRNLQLGPNAECINYIPGGTGFNVIEIDSVRCDGWTGSGLDFRLNGSANGTNLLINNTYMANGLSSPVSYDLSGVQGSLTNTAEDHNVANAIGYRFGTTASNRGCIEARNIQVEGSSLSSQTGIQIGATCAVLVSPYINTDGTPISLTSASSTTIIINPTSSGTVNANSIVYGASVTGQHVLIGSSFLDKPILNSSAVIVEEHALSYQIFPGRIGCNLSNGAAPNGSLELNCADVGGNTTIFLDRSGAIKQRIGNEGAAGNIITGSAQDDMALRTAGGAINFSTNGGASRGFVLPANFGGLSQPVIAASFTTTAATTDNITVTGMTSSGHCSVDPTNAGAAGGVASVFVSAKAANQITVTHTATAGWTFDVMCTPN